MATKEKAQHTAGPWRAHLNEPTALVPGHIIKTKRQPYSPIALLWEGGGAHGQERQRANARLIESAPELLAALEGISAFSHSLTGRTFNWGAWERVEEQAEAAIRKARGE